MKIFDNLYLWWNGYCPKHKVRYSYSQSVGGRWCSTCLKIKYEKQDAKKPAKRLKLKNLGVAPDEIVII